MGNIEYIPLSGGSGGGGGNCNNTEDSASSAGAGGGACVLYSYLTNNVNGILSARGGNGGDSFSASGAGGGGSGGGFIVEGKLGLKVNAVDLSGGTGGKSTIIAAGQNGGNGGAGRIRVDGNYNTPAVVTPAQASQYIGLSTDTSHIVQPTFTLKGTGNGQPIHIYLKPLNGAWSPYATVSGYSNNQWQQQITLICPDTLFFVVAAQEVQNPNNGQYVVEPSLVFSQAAANILSTTHPSFTITITTENTTVCSGTVVTLSTENINGDNYTWSPTSGLNLETGALVIASPTTTTTYTLTVKNSGNCSSYASVTIGIEHCDYTLYTPNVFTPSGDGLNDLFLSEGILIAEFHIRIFNRWGELIFQANDINQGWDGKYKNEFMKDGIYVYVITGKGTDNNSFNRTGIITLIK